MVGAVHSAAVAPVETTDQNPQRPSQVAAFNLQHVTMKKTIVLCLAATLAACGGTEPEVTNPPGNNTQVVEVLDETLPADGAMVTEMDGRASNGTGDVTLAAQGTAEQRSLVEALSKVPTDKRRQLSSLMECEEGRLAAPVPDSERPAFIEKTLAQLEADPNAVRACRAAAQGAAQ